MGHLNSVLYWHGDDGGSETKCGPDRFFDHFFRDKGPDPVMDDDDLRIHGKGIQPVSYRVLSPFSTRDDLGDLPVLKFFDDFFQAIILILAANHQEDGPNGGTGVELIKSMGEDRFFPQGEDLFLSSLPESLTLTR